MSELEQVSAFYGDVQVLLAFLLRSRKMRLWR